MVVTFGAFAIRLALAVVLAGAGLAFAGLITRRSPLMEASRRALLAAALLIGASTLALVMAFLEPATTPMRLSYVAQHSSRDMPAFYKVAALWGGMSGSLLFWTFLLGLMSSLAFLRPSPAARVGTDSGALFALHGVLAFFLVSLVAVKGCQPFTLLPELRADGRGLNPLLQHPAMAIHPPLLYIGFVSLTLPYAFCVGALLSGELGRDWIARCRRWTIFGWTILSAGIVLGGYWAYVELGWGGVWAWDPVENASFLPWLVMTAFLHSVMVQEHRGMLKVWNASLAILAFWMTLFGTFLTRSGVLASVHTFAENKDVFWSFAAFMGLVAVSGAGLVVWRVATGELKSEHRLESFLSREFAFVANNLLFLALTLTVLVGTVYPSFSEQVLGQARAIGPPWFNMMTVPLFALLIVLMGAGPVIAWRRASLASVRRTLLGPAIAGVSVAAATGGWVAWRYGGSLGAFSSVASAIVFGAVAFVLATHLGELLRGAAARQRAHGEAWVVAALRMALSNRRRYGGYAVHLAVLVIACGFAAHSVFKVVDERTLAVGESMRVGPYELSYLGSARTEQHEYGALRARVLVRRDGQPVTTLVTENRLYRASGQSTSEVALHKTFVHDLYLVAVGHPEEGVKTTFLVHINPLIDLVFAGTALLALGALFAAWPSARRRSLDQLALRSA